MPTSTERTFESRAAAPAARLVSAPKAPSLEEITPQHYARLNPAQKKEMVDKLIDFLKSI
jgi:hypothetical protein